MPSNNLMMSAVKPMRLSFKHILEPNEGNTTATSPFKKRLNDLFSANSKQGFAFEDIILNTQNNSPERKLHSPSKQGGGIFGSILRGSAQKKRGYIEGSPSQKTGEFEMHFIQSNGTEEDEHENKLRINRNLTNLSHYPNPSVDEQSFYEENGSHAITIDSLKRALQ